VPMKIVRLETTEPSYGLLALRVHTDEGLVGSGETYYLPETVAAVIHEWMARRLLGADPLATEAHWRFLYERAMNFGGRGAELRALSAIDLALWDIKGQVCGQPVWQLLGGRVQPGVRVYCSTGYGRNAPPAPGGMWPGYGRMGGPEPLNDYHRALHEPAAWARELVAEGFTGAKLWTLDFAAHKPGGSCYVSAADLAQGVAPFLAIREAVGDALELVLDGHGFFQLPAARRIAEVMRPVRPLCLEDVIRPDGVDAIADFRRQCGLPLAVSEMLTAPEDYRLVLQRGAADYVMIDPTWVGGISATLRMTDLAQVHNVPVMMHDCTGPLTLLAGVHVGIARANVAWQEMVRLLVRVTYPELVTALPPVADGRIAAPEGPGLGAAWQDRYFADPATVRVSAI